MVCQYKLLTARLLIVGPPDSTNVTARMADDDATSSFSVFSFYIFNVNGIEARSYAVPCTVVSHMDLCEVDCKFRTIKIGGQEDLPHLQVCCCHETTPLRVES